MLKFYTIFILLFSLPALALEVPAVLQGQVKDSNGKIIPKASIRLEPDGRSGISDAKGNFQIKNIYPGRYQLTVSCVGYQSYTTSILIQSGQTFIQNVTLAASDQQLNDIDISGKRQNADNVLQGSQSAQIVQLITKEKIQEMGSRRLDEVLREQTGMAVVSDLGNGNRSIGLQMQGFSSDYITILLNGQPMGGRHSGNFDLSRISVADIERIEVIKGASCSFYGSEALGGTVNIITRQNITSPQVIAGFTQGTYSTTDANLSLESPFASGNGYAYLSGNYYRTAGFNVNPYLQEGKTAPPYNSFSLQGRGRYRLSKGSALNVTAHYSDRNSVMDRNYGAKPTRDVLDEKDMSAMLSLDNNLENGNRLISRYYFTRYSSLQNVSYLSDGGLLQQNNFTEYRHKGEVQHSFKLTDQHLTISSGLGAEYQLNVAAVNDAGGNMLNYFGYSQANWEPSQTFSAVAGLRYDGNDVYGGRLNPTGGINYQPYSWLGFKASVGTGFKSPTYAQLYQRFTNLSQGYTVLGANNIQKDLAELTASGDIKQVWENAAQVTELKPESSASYNLQTTIKPFQNLELSLNGFYNRIKNLIISQQIGIKTNGSQLFSWFNIADMYSKGLEASISWQAFKGFNVSAGYQFLDMKDRAVIKGIKEGTGNFGTVRSNSGIRTATTADYFGLPNRSRHMGNVQVGYYINPLGVNVSLRAVYRGKYGFLDIDNNGYIDPYDVYVKSYVLLNGSIQKKLLKDRLTLQVTADNIADYTNYLMPAQPGRMVLAGLTWTFRKNTNL